MLILILGFFLLSLLGTGWYRGYAVSRHILDIPNDRSAHTIPTPRGGGMVFVGCFLIAMFYFYRAQYICLPLAALGIAILGYCDDKYSLSAKKRLAGHFILSILVIAIFSPFPSIQMGPWAVPFSIWTACFSVIYLVWMLNLYNFMDGINGIAGCEAICVALGMAILFWFSGHTDAVGLALLLAACVAGFLVWNFPKAKLFMGDAGSGFLGFVFGVWSLQAVYFDTNFFCSSLILLGVFIVDATITLLVRMMRKQKLYMAHSSHAYQHAARRFASHSPVTLIVIGLNVLLLWPLAFAVGLHYLNGLTGICLAYIPLIILSCLLKAGRT